MKPDPIKAHIERAAKSFDAEVHTTSYARTHFDDTQLRRLLLYLSDASGQTFLDLGTGSGYVAMALAKEHPASRIIGLDIAEQAIQQNSENAKRQGLHNIDFRIFDGITFPFSDNCFDVAFSRYAFHHFPRPETTLGEITRTVRPGGKYILADAIQHNIDTSDFINQFQDLKQDGHVRMHRPEKLIELVCRHGFECIDSFESSISFSRPRNQQYDELLAKTPDAIQKAYRVRIDGNDIHLTFGILNAVFLHQAQ